MIRSTAAASLCLSILALAACTQDTTRYPSLALRPIETRSEAEPEAPPAVAAAPDPALDAELARLMAMLDQTDAKFKSGTVAAGKAAQARGARIVGSDAWIAAQSALADLDALRGDTLGAVSDLEQLVTDRGVAGTAPYAMLDATRARAQDQLDQETATIATVKASLGEN